MIDVKYKISKRRYMILKVKSKEEKEIVNMLNNELSKELYDEKIIRKKVISLDLLKEKGIEPFVEPNLRDFEKEKLIMKLYKAINYLTSKQKEIIKLHFFYNVSLRKIAKLKNVSYSSIHEAYISALKKIKKYMSNIKE